MGSIGQAAQRLASSVAATADLPTISRGTALRRVLREDVCAPVLAATAHGDDLPAPELSELGAAISAQVPDGAEAGLAPRDRVLVALLRYGRIEPAWTLAHENGTGTVQRPTTFSTWSGGTRSSTRLPLVTLVEGTHAYAWLPGFRDPRWAVPDEVYALTDEIEVRSQLDEVRVLPNVVRLSGWGYLTHLVARDEDSVAIVLHCADQSPIHLQGQRRRWPDLVKGTGPDLTRLAWAGWTVDLDPRIVPNGEWHVDLEIGHGELRRTAALGGRRGPLAEASMLRTPHELHARVLRFGAAPKGSLKLRVHPLGATARILPRPVRRAARAAVRRG